MLESLSRLGGLGVVDLLVEGEGVGPCLLSVFVAVGGQVGVAGAAERLGLDVGVGQVSGQFSLLAVEVERGFEIAIQ